MCKKNKRCNCWISLTDIGVNAEGCLRDISWLKEANIPCSQSIINEMYYVDDSRVKIKCIKNVAHGSFGFIDKGILTRGGINREVYIKRPIQAKKSLLYEACIQKLASDNLEAFGYISGAPKVEYIFKLHNGSVCFAMETIPNSMTLCEFLKDTTKTKFQDIILDCLVQVCGMLWYLESEFGINHRDLKPSNFLVQTHLPEKKVIYVKDEILEIESKYSISFIDFGFSCLGSNETYISDISLSSVYTKCDPCPKNGRDMYLFIACLYIAYNNKMSDEMAELFKKWLHIPGTDISAFFKKYGNDSINWVYFLTGNPSITEFKSTPHRVIRDLAKFIHAY